MLKKTLTYDLVRGIALRPDIAKTVDWALKTSDLPTYQSYFEQSPKKSRPTIPPPSSVSSPFASMC